MLSQTKQRKFISPTQTLSDALGCVQPKFSTLMQQLIKLQGIKYQLTQQLLNLCQDTFVLLNSNSISKPSDDMRDFLSFEALFDDCISFLILKEGKNKYVQCASIEFRDFQLDHKTINFAKNILERSFIRKLFNYAKHSVLYNILCNYTIILKYKTQYVQVAGRALSLDFNTLLSDKRKKNQNLIIDPYQINIRRTLIFYCSHINRSSGFFHRNIFFDKGIKVSEAKQQLKIVTTKVYQNFQANLNFLSTKYLQNFYILLQKTFINFRKIFSLRPFKNKQRCYFQCMLKNLCPLPENYKHLKNITQKAIQSNQQSCQGLFDELYSYASDYSNVVRLLRALLIEVIPKQLIGNQNLQKLKYLMKDFVQMKRYQNPRMEDYLRQMNIYQIPWLQVQHSKKYKNQILKRGNKVLGQIISFILNDIIIPVIKFHFYVTQQHKQANKIFYYRKPLWILISKLALFKFSQQNLNKLNSQEANLKRHCSDHYPEGKLRILPKKGTFRPIITFNKKMKAQKNSSVKLTLHKILGNTQLVLRNMKNNLWENLGFSVFDNRQIKKKYDQFVINWRKQDCPKLAYFTLDIKKCYDSINTSKLLEIIEKTPFIQHFYFIKKYQIMYRNKRPLIGNHHIGSYFNLKDRIAATPLSIDPFIINQNDSIPSVTIFTTRQRSISKQKVIENLRQLCQGSIINYKKQSWSQNHGIPQGLNVSGVLCSLYFGSLENKYVRRHVKKGLLMRLTDDYLYLGYQDQARQVLSSLIKCAAENQFKFSDSKMSKNFFHKDYPKINQKDFIIWIGKKIDLKTLQMQPNFQSNDKIQFAMNVNLKRSNIKSFMKNKLKSLLTNHFQSYFKPHLFSIQVNIKTIKIFIKVSLQKFYPFLKRYFTLKFQNPQLQLLQILESTFHDYILYICMLMKKPDNDNYTFIKRYVIEEALDFFNKRKSQKQFKFLWISLNRKLENIKNAHVFNSFRAQKIQEQKQNIQIQ